MNTMVCIKSFYVGVYQIHATIVSLFRDRLTLNQDLYNNQEWVNL